MRFKVRIYGELPDMRVNMDLLTNSFERLEQIQRYAIKNKLQYKMEIIDE